MKSNILNKLQCRSVTKLAKTLDGLVIPTVASNVQQAVKMKNGNIGKVSQEVMENGTLTNYSESMVIILPFTKVITY